jgi:hypothetical protein
VTAAPGRAALAILLALVLAGCGASALTTPVLRDRAADACSAATARVTKIAAPSRPSATLAFLRRGIEVLTRQYTALRDLDAGGAAAPIFRRAVAALDAELQDLRGAAVALARGADPLSTFKDLQVRLTPLEQDADAAWSELQISACLTA